ncbi:MAG: rubredoxin [Nitrospirota bacterium]
MAVFKCDKCGATKEGRCKPRKCPKCGASGTMTKKQ